MKILCTGDQGFIGKALVAELEAAGHEVKGFDLVRQGEDICSALQFDISLIDSQADVVIHLAAQVGKKFCDDRPQHAVDVNILGTLNVAKMCAKHGVKLVYVSTSEVYGDRGDEMVDETANLDAKRSGMYAITKLAGEDVCRIFAPDGLKILRLVMPYGPGVPPGPGRRALDNLIWQALTGQPMVVHHGAARSWCWIGDVASGMRAVVECGEPGTYNVGRDDDEVSMEDLAMMIREGIMGRGFRCPHQGEFIGPVSCPVSIVEGPPNQTLVKRLSTKKLSDLGWRPKVSLEEGLPSVRHWLLDNKHLWPVIEGS